MPRKAQGSRRWGQTHPSLDSEPGPCLQKHRLMAVQIPEFIHTQQALSGDRVKMAKRGKWNKRQVRPSAQHGNGCLPRPLQTCRIRPRHRCGVQFGP